MIERQGDLLSVTQGIIAHGCNAQGVMGAGVALQIKQKYPKVYKEYTEWCKDKDPQELMGQALCVKATDDLIILNMITQNFYGRAKGCRYVSYDAIDTAFTLLSNYMDYTGKNSIVNIPMIGAGLGGGNWNVIKEIIDFRMKEKDVVLWKL